MAVKAFFEYDDQKGWICGDVQIDISACKFRGVQIPEKYLPLLFDEDCKEEVMRLLQETVAFKSAYEYVLEAAASKDFKTAWHRLNELRAAAPHGPTFYREYPYRIALTDGNKAFSFITKFNSDALDLPENYYAEGNYYDLNMTVEEYERAQKIRARLWNLMERLDKHYEDARQSRLCSIIKTFLSPEGELAAYEKLRQLEKSLMHAAARDEAYDELVKKQVIGINGGYMVADTTNVYFPSIYLVSNDGEVRQLKEEPHSRLREVVYKLKQGKMINPKTKPVYKTDVEKVARILGQYGKPELALLILP